MTDSKVKADTQQTGQEAGAAIEYAANEFTSAPLASPVPEPLDTPQVQFSEADVEEFLAALKRSKQELDIARQQFDNVTDQRLIDHVVFRLGAAERHFSYLLQIARQWGLAVHGTRWDWFEEA